MPIQEQSGQALDNVQGFGDLIHRHRLAAQNPDGTPMTKQEVVKGLRLRDRRAPGTGAYGSIEDGFGLPVNGERFIDDLFDTLHIPVPADPNDPNPRYDAWRQAKDVLEQDKQKQLQRRSGPATP